MAHLSPLLASDSCLILTTEAVRSSNLSFPFVLEASVKVFVQGVERLCSVCRLGSVPGQSLHLEGMAFPFATQRPSQAQDDVLTFCSVEGG